MKVLRLLTYSLIASSLIACGGSQQYRTQQTVYDSGGRVTETRVDSGGQVISELRRQFQDSTLTGQGSIRNTNEGLARRAATQLAVSELAAKVEASPAELLKKLFELGVIQPVCQRPNPDFAHGL